MALQFKKATKQQAPAKIAIIGPAGSGKTWTALELATALGEKVAVIDTEHGSASKYSDIFEFDVLELESFHPKLYVEAIKVAEKAGYHALVIDSLSHAWSGKDGAIELVEKYKTRYRGNKFAAWADVTPLHNQLIDTINGSPLHIIATMRSKMEYIQVANDRGKTEIKKVGLAPIQRDGMEYEFDVVGEMDLDHNFVVTKTRCHLLDSAIINKPGKELGEKILSWLSDGKPAEKPKPAKKPQQKKEPPKPKKGDIERKKFFATLQEWTTEQGFNWEDVDKHSRALICEGMKVRSRSELTPEQWEKLNDSTWFEALCGNIKKELGGKKDD